jgi:serine/threonine-protein kinase
MSTNQPEPVEEQFNSLLANLEEARRAGATPPRASAANLPPELQQELERDLACADLLHQVLQPLGPDPGPDPRKTVDFTGEPSPAAGPELSPDLPWPSLGRFQLRRELGRGTFGIVYLAYDPGLGREVALKVPRLDALADPQLRERFQREARAAAGLEHPHVVPVYEAGEVGPVCYIASAYCPGPTLAQWLKQRDQPVLVRQAAALVALLADGVHHAHTRGVVHRDLKPANVLLAVSPTEAHAPSGQPAESGFLDATPRIADFGLAKILLEAGEASPTQSGAIVGTAEYMAPEQAGGKREEVGPAADIYALGVILYELLTGRPPLQAETPLETLLLVRSEDPLPPGRLRPKLPRDLETICLKCLQKEPRQRYASAQALGDDLRRFLAGEPVQARPTPAWVRGLKWAKRRPASAALLGVSAVALLALGGLGGTWAWWLERSERQESERRSAAMIREDRMRVAVETTLKQVGELQRQARWAEAEAALVLALSRLDQEGTDDLRQRLAQARTNLRLVKRLNDIRLQQATLIEGRDNNRGAAADYAKAFAEYGLDVLAGEKGEVARQIATSPIHEQLLAGLDDWALVLYLQDDINPLKRVLEVAQQADPDKRRARLRDVNLLQDRRRLEKLASDAEVESSPPELLSLLAYILHRAGGDPVPLLERAQRRHPGDFWLNYNLGQVLRDTQKGRVEEAVGYFRAALAVRPRTPLVYNELGRAFQANRDLPNAIACYQKALELDPKLAPVHSNLGLALADQGDVKGAIACCKRAIELDPNSRGAHEVLGAVLKAKGDLKGAIDCLKKVLALNPKDAMAHYNLGVALQAKRDLKGAIDCYTKAFTLDPKAAPAHLNLGIVLQAQGNLEGAIACYRKALDLDPKYVLAHNNLGNGLWAQGDVKRAMACYHKAIDLEPKDALAHNNLGWALQAQGDLKGAIACYRKALDLDPKYVLAHNNLGDALYRQGDLKGAIDCCKQALDLDPKDAKTHYNLGTALFKQGDVKGAIACYRQALDLDPKHAEAHYGLGTALYAKKDLDAAIASYQEALVLNPKYAETHCNLGHALRDQGRFAEALQFLKRGHEIGSKRADWSYPSARWVSDCQCLLDLDAKLPAFLEKKIQPADAAEQFALADLCQRYKKRYAAAVRFYSDAFAAGAALTSQRAYHAGCAAVLAASGKGEDDAKIDAKEKGRLHQQARAWLHDALKSQTERLEDADAKTRKAVQQTLQHWQQDADLASVRDLKALTQLSQTERVAWQQFWAEVEILVGKSSP